MGTFCVPGAAVGTEDRGIKNIPKSMPSQLGRNRKINNIFR
jgi:hypothetical protein